MSLRASFQMMRNQTPISAQQALAQKDWYLFFVNLYRAVTDGASQPEEAVVVSASPMTYTAVIKGQALVAGGTVSSIQFSRDGTTFYNAGITAGFVQMDARDLLRVTYTVAPTIAFFPM